MSIKNSYPELPEIKYQHTSVEMPFVVAYAKTLTGIYSADVLKMAYAIFRNESGNGAKGINNNYAGIQADCGRWNNLTGKPVATSIKFDGKAMRRFLCFDEAGYKVSFETLCIKVEQRQITTALDYFKKWAGRPGSTIEKQNFESLLRSAEKVFSPD